MIHAASGPMQKDAARRSPFRALAILGLVVLPLALFSGCNTGSRNDATGPPVVPPPPDFPQLQDVNPQEGKPGDLITLTGKNFAPDVEDNLVSFSDNSGTVSLLGKVESVNVGLFDPTDGAPSTLTVRVPPGVRTGFIGLTVIQAGNRLPAGGVGFTGAPVILGYAIDDDGQGATVRYDALGNIFPDTIQLIGYNLINNVTECTVSDSSPQTLDAPSVTNGAGLNATYTLQAGLEAVSIELPGGLIPNDCQSDTLIFLASAAGASGFPLNAAPIEIPYAQLQGPGNLSDIPAYVTGAVTPAGVRTGDIRVDFNLMADPSPARWDVIFEYQDPADPNGNTFFPCTASTSSPTAGTGLLPGIIDQPSLNPGIIGPGQAYSYIWDSAIDLPPGSGNIVTRIRMRTANPNPSSAVNSAACAGRWVTDWLVIDNDAPTSGSIFEGFSDDDQEDPTTTALWNPNGTGTLTAGPGLPDPNWGTGQDDVVLSAGSTYQLDTNFGTLFDLTDMLNPVDLLPTGNPGAAENEFHVRSLVIESGAAITVLGDDPIVFRCSGDGTDSFLAAVIAGTITLDGGDGTEGDNGGNGVGGAGGTGGGGDGGDGAFVDIDAANQEVSGITTATSGELQGGGAGPSVTFIAFGTAPSIPKAGPGGGGGHAEPGEPGVNTFPSTSNFVAPVGKAGLPYGDTAITRIRGGSGGGGGGGTPVRLSATNFQAKHGGGGGGGGGAFAVIGRGSIQLTGTVTADGGNGAKGSSGSQSGAGGGGAGGSILFRATGNVELGSDVELSAAGGFGAVTVPSTTNQQRGGDGAQGRIRIEANGQVLAPGFGDFTGVTPPMGTGGITNGAAAGINSIQIGTGIDGPLGANVFGTAGTFTVDTAQGKIFDSMGIEVFQNASGTGTFELASLDLPEMVTLIGDGPNPLIFQVTGPADVRGTINVSGQDGSIPDFTVPAAPTPGDGGAQGAGGGAGGIGATADLAGVAFAGAGGMPPTMPSELIDGGPPIGGGNGPGGPTPGALASPAKVAFSILGDGTCAAGGAGGGGYGAAGVNGGMIAGCPESGEGGSTYGSTFFLVQDPVNPPNAIELLVGGGGGAGGASFSDGVAVIAPGAGGGGAGGFVQISAGGQLTIFSTAAILAVGGDAYQGPVSSGNPGAGAGGAIRVQGQSIVVIEANSMFDVRGGMANLDPVAAGLNPLYAPNGQTNGGNGGSGRIRIETPLGFADGSTPSCGQDFSCGQFSTAGLNESIGISLEYPVSADGVSRVSPAAFQLLSEYATFATPLPADAHAITLFQGAFSNDSNSARPGEWFGLTDDPTLLDGVDFIRLQVFLYSSPTSAPEVDSVDLPF